MPNEIAPLFTGADLLRATPNPLDPFGITEGYAVAHRKDGAGNVGSDSIRLCILGEPASKANGRQIAKRGKRWASIKSHKALDYETIALPQIAAQCGKAGWKCRAVGPMRVTMTIHYASNVRTWMNPSSWTSCIERLRQRSASQGKAHLPRHRPDESAHRNTRGGFVMTWVASKCRAFPRKVALPGACIARLLLER